MQELQVVRARERLENRCYDCARDARITNICGARKARVGKSCALKAHPTSGSEQSSCRAHTRQPCRWRRVLETTSRTPGSSTASSDERAGGALGLCHACTKNAVIKSVRGRSCTAMKPPVVTRGKPDTGDDAVASGRPVCLATANSSVR